MTPWGLNGREDVAAFIAFCDGFEEAGFVDYARRGRAIARDLELTLRELADERSARIAMQEARDRLLEILQTRASRAA
jgi:hypothetical protein